MTDAKTGWTPGPWFVSGVRFRMNGSEWHSVNRYDETLKKDQNIACVGYDPRTGDGHADAHLIAAAPELYSVLERLLDWVGPIAGDNIDKDSRETEIESVEQAESAMRKARGEQS